MGAVTVKSTVISNADQLYPKIPSGPYLGKGPLYSAVGTLEVGAADSAGSVYRFARIPSGARLHELKIFSDAITGFTSGSVGLYAPQDQSGNAGASVSTALFGSGIDFSVAQTEPYDVIFNNLGIENVEKRVWELLALSSDPQVMYDIVIQSVTQSGGAGTLSMILAYTI
jgi:hypothetical protein